MLSSDMSMAEIFAEALKELEGAEDKDFVKVIRCKDCRYKAKDGFCKGRGWPMQLVPDDGFCDKGKRSEE